MTVARFRFYEELNDFLTPEHQKREFEARCARAATVKNAIEALGVPHTEVELILVNGRSVDFSYRMLHGDRVSVYPMFEAFDIEPLLRVRGQALSVTRFPTSSRTAPVWLLVISTVMDTRIFFSGAEWCRGVTGSYRRVTCCRTTAAVISPT